MTEPRRTSAHRRAAWRWRALLAALLTAALIAGCAQTPPANGYPDPEPQVLRGTVAVPVEPGEPEVPVLGVSLLLMEAAPMVTALEQGDAALGDALGAGLGGPADGASALPASTVVDAGDGAYLAGLALVDADGGYELVLPDGADLPATLLAPAADGLVLDLLLGDADCSVVASDPTARMTPTAWFLFLSVPAPIYYLPSGVGLGFTLTEPVDLDGGTEEDSVFVTVVYATAPTTLGVTGPECTNEVFSVSADVPLVAGWNQVIWTLDDTSMAIGARSIDEPVFSVVFFTGER